MKLTREKALELHRKMWTDMQRELGDCPTACQRVIYKERWCENYGYKGICNDCFLCEYTAGLDISCDDCPIDWGSLSTNEDETICMGRYDGFGGIGFIHSTALISEILALPERKDK